jgi:hypothetical protein
VPRWARLATNQLNDGDHASGFRGLLTEVGVLRVDAFGKVPQPAPLRLVLDNLRAEPEAAEQETSGFARRL